MVPAIVALVIALLSSADDSSAQAKKGNNEEAVLRKQIQNLKQRIDQLEAQLKERNSQTNKLKAEAKQDDKEIDKLRQTAKEVDKLRQNAKELEALRDARYVHTLILRLKPDADKKEAKALLDSAEKTLGKVAGVRGVWVGKPAGASAEGVETNYHVGLTILFDNADGYFRYQKDAAQKKFAEGLKKSWTQTIYDFQP
jgi:chromosome segregation ATPase